VVEDDHIANARQMIREVEHPIAGPMKVIGSTVNLSEPPAQVHSPAAVLGQRTDSALKDVLHLTAAEISSLKATKAIG